MQSVGLVARLSTRRRPDPQTARAERVQSRATRAQGNKGPMWQGKASKAMNHGQVTGPAHEEDEKQPNPEHCRQYLSTHT
jgi:hypothetical protein